MSKNDNALTETVKKIHFNFINLQLTIFFSSYNVDNTSPRRSLILKNILHYMLLKLSKIT